MRIRISKYLVLISFLMLSAVAIYINFDRIENIAAHDFSKYFQNTQAETVKTSKHLNPNEETSQSHHKIDTNITLLPRQEEKFLFKNDQDAGGAIGDTMGKDDITIHQDIMISYINAFSLAKDIDINDLNYSVEILEKIENEKLFFDMKPQINSLILDIKKLQAIRPTPVYPMDFAFFRWIESLFKITYLHTEELENQRKKVQNEMKDFKINLYKKDRVSKIFEER